MEGGGGREGGRGGRGGGREGEREIERDRDSIEWQRCGRTPWFLGLTCHFKTPATS